MPTGKKSILRRRHPLNEGHLSSVSAFFLSGYAMNVPCIKSPIVRGPHAIPQCLSVGRFFFFLSPPSYLLLPLTAQVKFEIITEKKEKRKAHTTPMFLGCTVREGALKERASFAQESVVAASCKKVAKPLLPFPPTVCTFFSSLHSDFSGMRQVE